MQTTTGWMDTIARLCLKKSNIAIVSAMVIIGLMAGVFDSRLKVGDTFPGSPILWPDSVYNQDCKVINENLDDAGTDMISIIVEGSEEGAVLATDVIMRMDLYERYITYKHPEVVAGTQSITKIVKTLHKEFHEGNALYFSIPHDRRLITNLLFFYAMAGDPSDFTTIANARYEHTIIRVFLKDHNGDTLKDVVDSTRDFFASQPEIPGISFRFAAGYGGIIAATNEEIKTSQAATLALVFLTVFVFCGLAYRSVVAAVLLCVPLLVANLVAFAYMVFKDIGLDVNVLPVSAVGIGVGVDYGIYILSRMEEEFKNTGGNWEAMTHTSLNTAGKGVVITAITVIIPILLWPLMANMKFQAEMGLLLAFIMFFSMLGALFFLPAAVNLIKPKFMYKHARLAQQLQPDSAPTGGLLPAVEHDGLFSAIAWGDVPAVKKFIAAGEPVNAAGGNGRLPLMEAVAVVDSRARNEIVKMLLRSAADVSARDRHDITALDLAVSYGFSDTVALLLDAGAELNTGRPAAGTPLGTAITQGNVSMMAQLLDAGARVDAALIRLAADYRDKVHSNTAMVMLKLFAQKGVDVAMADEGGTSMLEYIRSVSGLEKLAQAVKR